MLPPVTGIDSPGGDVLNHVWALKERSGQAFHEAVSAVRGFLERGDSIYPPICSSFTGIEAKPVANFTDSKYIGTLLAEEAVAASILYLESQSLTYAPRKGFGDKIHEALGLQDIGDDVLKVVDGIAMFGNRLGNVAWVREQLLLYSGNLRRKVSSSSNDESIPRLMMLTYTEALRKDGMKIGQNTLNSIVEEIRKETELQIILDEIQDSVIDDDANQIHKSPNAKSNYWTLGAKKAADLFLEASELAFKQFPNNG